MVLTVAAYDAAEKQAEGAVPNRIIEACRPEHFLKAGYPTMIPDDSGLPRYFDVMHEMREEEDYRTLVHGFTPEEFELFKDLSTKAAAYSEEVFGRRMVPKGAITRAMITFRHIRFLSELEDTTVVEIGPGSGYLGAILALAGYRYVGTDITQAFYLQQSRMWQHMFGDRFIELATAPQNFSDFGELSPGTVMHVPWWKFTIADAPEIKLRADVVVANHTLCEMHTAAMNYDILLARHMLERSPHLGYFFVEGPGAQVLRDRFTAYQQFQTAGFHRVFGDDGSIDVFAPNAFQDRLTEGITARAATHDAAPVAHKEPMPPVNGGRLAALTNPQFLGWAARRAGHILREPGGLSKLGRKTLRFATATPTPSIETAQGPAVAQANRPDFSNTVPPYTNYVEPYTNYADNVISRQILECRRTFGQQERLPYEAIQAFQNELARGADLRTDDERFFAYVYGAEYYS